MHLARAIVCALLLAGGVARADRLERSRALYQEGEQSYRSGQFQAAYDQFKEAYLVSKQPVLLYDMASALEGLGRPHDAADELRAYLRARPDDPRKSAIESRVRALEEAQRILDAELLKRTPATLKPLPDQPPPFWTRRRVTFTIAGAVLGTAIAAIAIGVGVAFGSPGYPASTLGAHRATP
jgi:hypothetical protein